MKQKENEFYLAYGSNLNLRQMQYRCPTAKPLGPAELLGYSLLFRGSKGHAVATVEPNPDSLVPVLLWEITPCDEASLDRYEGWPNFYRKEIQSVCFQGKNIEAMIYIMNPGAPLGSPSPFYLGTIAEGYTASGFNVDYLTEAIRLSAKNA